MLLQPTLLLLAQVPAAVQGPAASTPLATAGADNTGRKSETLVVPLQRHPEDGCCSSIFASGAHTYFSSCRLPTAGQMEQGKEGVLIPLREQASCSAVFTPS